MLTCVTECVCTTARARVCVCVCVCACVRERERVNNDSVARNVLQTELETADVIINNKIVADT